jgi:4-hydroxy-2-oxoglutarate aldolase
MSGLKLEGVLPPLTTPFDERGEVDTTRLAQNVARYNEAGLAGYVALGSNGEAIHMTPLERMRVIETIKRAARAGMTIIAGVNELSTQAAIESAQQAASAGAEAVLVITPYYYKGAMTQQALARHFIAVADHCPVPVILYNFPQNTGVSLEPETIAHIAAHPNIIGVKDSAGNVAALSETIRLVPADFAVMVGNGSIVYPSLMMGAMGAILAIACVAPRACVDLYQAAKSGDHLRARELQNRIAPLAQLVTAKLGVAGLKAAVEMAGYAGGAPRLPLLPVSDSDREKIKVAMRESGLFPEIE